MFTYTATLADGTALPSFITFDDTTKEFTVSTTDYTLDGTYNIKLIATLDDAAGSYNDEVEFTLTVSNCESVTITAI